MTKKKQKKILQSIYLWMYHKYDDDGSVKYVPKNKWTTF